MPRFTVTFERTVTVHRVDVLHATMGVEADTAEGAREIAFATVKNNAKALPSYNWKTTHGEDVEAKADAVISRMTDEYGDEMPLIDHIVIRGASGSHPDPKDLRRQIEASIKPSKPFNFEIITLSN